MLLPASGPRSNWSALGRRLSEENSWRILWASSGIAPPVRAATITRSDALVEPLKGRPREIRRENLAVIVPRPRPAHRAPLAQPDPVSRPRPHGRQPRDLAVLFRHGE